MSETHIYIYGQIGQGGITAEFIRKKLATAGASVDIHINSPGGEVYEGYTIYNLLRNCGKPVNVVIEGLCASIATLIACAGDKITMNPTAEFMIHNPMVGIEGDSEDLRKVADQLDNIKKTIIAAYKRKTSKSDEELWDMMNKETFFSAEQAMQNGFVDEVAQSVRMVAYFDMTKLKPENTMENKVIEVINAFEKKLEGLFKSKPKNLDATLADGTQIIIETEDEADLNQKSVLVVTPEGTQAAPDGEYTLADGRIIVVAGGKIAEVKQPAAPEDVEALKAKIEDLTNQLTAKNTEIENSKTELETVKAETETLKVEVTEVKNEFEKIRNIALGNSKDPKKVFFNKTDEKEDSYVNGLVNLIKNKN